MMPMAVISDPWKTMAPVTLPIARVSFPLLIQITLLNFSGSSVAIGAIIMASMKGDIPISSEMICTFSTKIYDPHTISSSELSTWKTMMVMCGSWDLGAK